MHALVCNALALMHVCILRVGEDDGGVVVVRAAWRASRSRVGVTKVGGVMSGPEASASARRGVDSVTVAVLLLAVMPFTTDWMPQASAEEEAAERAAIGWSTAELGQGSVAWTVSNTGQVVAQPVAAVASAVLIPGQVPTGPLQLVGAVPVPIREEAMPEAVILGPYAGELVFGPDLVSAEDVGALARTFKKR